jgi:predicted metal-dependent hydrolase
MPQPPNLPEAFRRGIACFNRQEFFAAHEHLEDAWRATHGHARLFLQGLTQVAVAMHHHSTGNVAGGTSVLARALRNLEGYPERYAGIELERLRQDLQAFHAGIVESTAPGAVPQIFQTPDAATDPAVSE